MFTTLELTNADLNVAQFKYTLTILETASVPQDTIQSREYAVSAATNKFLIQRMESVSHGVE
jgi:hypothetical protein